MLKSLLSLNQSNIQKYTGRRRFAKFWRRWRYLGMMAPTALSIVYYGFFATPRFVSETQFVVRGLTTNRLSGLDALLRTFGISRAVDDANIIQSYVLSHDAVEELNQKIDLKMIFANPKADALSRFPRPWEHDTFEDLRRHYLDRLSVVQDTNRGISTIRAQAFTAIDAQKMSLEVLKLAEALVNRLNERAHADAMAAAQREVKLSEERVIDAQLALTTFRNQASLVDPSKSSNSELETITVLSSDLAQAQVQIQETRQTAPGSPSIDGLRAKIAALQTSIDAERAKLAGDDQALAARVSTYERLTLVRDLADKSLSSTVLSLETARAEMRRQQIYIETIARPSLPDEPEEPRRIRMIFTVFASTLMLYAVLWVLLIGVKEKVH